MNLPELQQQLANTLNWHERKRLEKQIKDLEYQIQKAIEEEMKRNAIDSQPKLF